MTTKRVGVKIEEWGYDCLNFIDSHEMLLWVIGMILTACGGIYLFASAPDPITTKITLFIIGVPTIGWMWFIVYLVIACIPLAIGYGLQHPLKALLRTLIVVIIFFLLEGGTGLLIKMLH